MTLEQAGWIASIVGAAVAAIGLAFVGVQLVVALHEQRSAILASAEQQRQAIRLSTAQVLLTADAVLSTHSDVAAKLANGGEWAGSRELPKSDAQFRLVEPYLGVFESIFVAVDAGQINPAIASDRYGYRVANIWANKRLVDVKLQHPSRRLSWKLFIALTWALELERGERFTGHTDSYIPDGPFDEETCLQLDALPPASPATAEG